MDLSFDNEFRTLVPPLQPEELAQLEVRLEIEGNRDPIVIWKETKLLLDGHNRYDICHKLGKPLKPPLELSFPDRDAAKIWIIQNQFGRRNLSAYQRSLLALKLEDIFHRKAKSNESAGGYTAGVGRQKSANPVETRKELANLAKVSHDTIMKVKAIEEKATPEQKAKLAKGDASINGSLLRNCIPRIALIWH